MKYIIIKTKKKINYFLTTINYMVAHGYNFIMLLHLMTRQSWKSTYEQDTGHIYQWVILICIHL